MKAEVAFTPLLSAARALNPYTTPSRLLYLHAGGGTLTLTASTGEETASITLSGAVGDGHRAVAAKAVINALTVLKPAGRAAAHTVVTLHGEADRLRVRVGAGPTIDLDSENPAVPAPQVLAGTVSGLRPVTAGPVADWCDLVGGVASAASQDPTRPELAVVRLVRDHPQVVLMVEAGDRYRVHRGAWGDPDGEPVDLRMPVAATARAVRLLRTLDRAGVVTVYTDGSRVHWHTGRVCLSAATGGPAYPDVEKLREDVLAAASGSFAVDRRQLLSVLDTAHRLTAPVRHPRVRLEHRAPDSLDVVMPSGSGATMYTAHLAVHDVAGPVRHLLLNPNLVRDAVAFLDGDQVTVRTIPDRLPIYLEGVRRHAIVMQVAG